MVCTVNIGGALQGKLLHRNRVLSRAQTVCLNSTQDYQLLPFMVHPYLIEIEVFVCMQGCKQTLFAALP